MLHNLLVILPLYSPIDIYLDNDCTLNESMAKIQRRLWQHLSKSQVNGVEIFT